MTLFGAVSGKTGRKVSRCDREVCRRFFVTFFLFTAQFGMSSFQ
jgi:hypothetical protein